MHAFLAALYDARIRGELVHLHTIKLMPHYVPSSTMIQKIHLLGKMLKRIGVQVMRMEPDVPSSFVGQSLLTCSLRLCMILMTSNRCLRG
jgi:hypothetical protein